MSKVKTQTDVTSYRTIKKGNTEIEIPITTEENKTIMELNFNHFINVLSDILVRNSDLMDFNLGQIWETPISAIHKNIVWCFSYERFKHKQ